MNGMVGTNLMILLECRLDNVLFRMGLGRTRKEARQIVDHKHILVNGKQVNIPSYQVKAGDVIEVKEKFKSAQRYKDILEVPLDVWFLHGSRLIRRTCAARSKSFQPETRSTFL